MTRASTPDAPVTPVAVQDSYPPDVAVCYGCGRLNDDGLHIRTFWDGTEGTATFQPKPFHTAITGVVYGGREPVLRYVTGLLQVSFKAPTPMGGPLTLRAWPVEVGERKVVVDAEVIADSQVTVTGHVIAVRLRHDSTGSAAT